MLLVPQGDDVFADLDTDQLFFTRANGAVTTFHPNPSLVQPPRRPLNSPCFIWWPLWGLIVSLAALVIMLFRRPPQVARAHWLLIAAAAGPTVGVVAMAVLVGDPFSVVFGATPGLLVTLTLVNLAALLAVAGVVVLWRAGAAPGGRGATWWWPPWPCWRYWSSWWRWAFGTCSGTGSSGSPRPGGRY